MRTPPELMLAIDPGLRTVGVTVATHRGAVLDAWLARSPAKARQVDGVHVPAPEGPVAWRAMALAVIEDVRTRGHLERLTLLVVEWPEVYREAKKGKLAGHNPNDLLELAAVDGGLAAALPALARYERFTPRQWKKSFPKGDYQQAILAALTPEERALVERTTPSLRHNVIESVGLARFTATVLAGLPMSVPALQGRVAPAGGPAWRTPLPPSSIAGRESYGRRHGLAQGKPRPPTQQKLKALAKPASYRADGSTQNPNKPSP